jgi:hypothetical protein
VKKNRRGKEWEGWREEEKEEGSFFLHILSNNIETCFFMVMFNT